MMGVHIFECDDNEFIPQVFKDAAFYEMNFRGHKVIEDISTVFLDLIDQEANKQNFVLSDQEKNGC